MKPRQDLPASGSFIPEAGYGRTSKLQFFKRRLIENGAMPAAAPGQSLKVDGTRSIPVILVNFKNVPAPFPSEDYQKLLFDGTAER